MKSLAELRQSPRVGLPERTYTLCLASSLLGEVQALVEELAEVEQAEGVDEDGERKGPPKRMAETSRGPVIRARLGELREEMAEDSGELTLRAIDEGAWRRWVDEHPAREEHVRDESVAYGVCNADALLDDLATYAKAWNGEPLADGDWLWIKSQAAPGDLKAIARLVVMMHEAALNVPKLLNASLGILASESD